MSDLGSRDRGPAPVSGAEDSSCFVGWHPLQAPEWINYAVLKNMGLYPAGLAVAVPALSSQRQASQKHLLFR